MYYTPYTDVSKLEIAIENTLSFSRDIYIVLFDFKNKFNSSKSAEENSSHTHETRLDSEPVNVK